MLALILAAMLDQNAALFLSSCERELTNECGAYLRGFADAILAYDATVKELKTRDARIVVPRIACVPAVLDMERFRVEAVNAVRAKPARDPMPTWALATISKMYPCK